MGDLGNFFDLNDYNNARRSWLESMGKSYKKVRVYTFEGYETAGNQTNPNETFRKARYTSREDFVWLSQVKVFDTVKGGYFTTGDLDVYSEFVLKGFSPAYLLPSTVNLNEYSGDIIDWNGKLWEVADQLEPVTFGPYTKQVWYRTVLRRTNRSGIGIEVGATLL